MTDFSVLQRPLYLPAVLNDFTVREELPTNHYDTISSGEFAVSPAGGKTARKLRTTDIEALTLGWDAAWLTQAGLSHEDVYDELRALMRLKDAGVFELVAMLVLGSDQSEELRMQAKVIGVDRTLKHGEGDTRYYTLNVEEFRDSNVTRSTHSAQQGRGGVQLPTTHALKSGDTLHSLAYHYYGSYEAKAWHAIRDDGHNAIPRAWGQSVALVRLPRYNAGDKIWIPRKPS